MEKLTGIWELEPKRPVEILDLPGIYSIYPKSIDEELVINILGDPTHPDFPDMAIVVAAIALVLQSLMSVENYVTAKNSRCPEATRKL